MKWILSLAFVATSMAIPVSMAETKAAAKAKSNWHECVPYAEPKMTAIRSYESGNPNDYNLPTIDEYAKNKLQYNMEIQTGTEWVDASPNLVKCQNSENPLRLRYDGKDLQLRWPDGMTENDIFSMDDEGKMYYGIRLQVSSLEDQVWHFMHFRWSDLNKMNEFIGSSQARLNLRLDSINGKWRHLSDQDFVRAPKL